MKILYLHQYFNTPNEPGGTRSYYLSKALVESGHKVVMITSNRNNSDWKFIEKKQIDEIDVIYIKNPYSNNMKKFNRIFSFIRFMFISTYVSLREKDVDLVFATSTPLTIGFPALMCKWFKKKKFVFEVRDLWPDIPIELGLINNVILKRILFSFEKLLYKKAELVIALSQGMAKGIIHKYEKTNVSVIPNFSNNDIFFPVKNDNLLRNKLDISLTDIVCVHTGAMGKVNGLVKFTHQIIEKCNDDIHFVFIGDGLEKEKLAHLSNDILNLHIIDSVNKEVLNTYIQDCDFCLMLVDYVHKIYETNSANKFFDYLSSGKPIIMNYKGWKYEEIKKYNCGFYVDPTNPKELVDKIMSLQNTKEIIQQMGENSRILALEKFDRKKLAAGFVKIIEGIA